jgi:hypothetical protein
MSKLVKFKEWLTIPETARHLSGLFGEPVTEADVLRLALDGHLKLCVHFVNLSRARFGAWISGSEAEERRLGDFTDDMDATGDISFDDNKFLALKGPVQMIDGVWDLLLRDNGWLDIENRFQKLTGGPEVVPIICGPIIIKRADGYIGVLQRSYSSLNMKGERPDELDHHRNYFPEERLPDEDCVLVVRTSALTEFQSRITDESAAAQQARDTSQSTREKNTLLRIIGLMANHRYAGDIGQPHSIARHLTDKAQGLGIQPPSDDTIVKHLKAALALIGTERKS